MQKSGSQQRDEQMMIFELERPLFLKITRDIAKYLGKRYGVVSADMVRKTFEKTHPGIGWCNAAGAIFKEKCWRHVGYRASSIAGRKASVLRTWELVA